MSSSKTKSDAAVVPVGLPDWRELRGYDEMLARWRTLVDSGRLPQVLLVHGRAGLGKSRLAAALAAMLQCDAGAACGRCGPCREILAGAHGETLWLEAESGKFLLDDAARLQEHLELAPGAGARWRVAVVVDADRLTPQAANRLLKTLEEPPASARIVLTTSRLGGMLTTVLSRCVKWRVAPPAAEVSRRLVEERLRALGLGEDGARVEEILRRSGMAPGLALAACDELTAEGGQDAGREALRQLVRGESDPVRVLAAAEALSAFARDAGLGVAAMLQEWDIEINRSYREGSGLREPAAVARRRELLRRAKALAVRGHVALNAQLAAEGLALDGRR